MANDIDKTSPHYKGEFGCIYEVNQKFPNGGVAGDYVEIDGWAHYWNADRGTWCVNAQRDSYWDELITGIIEKFKFIKGATYMGVAGVNTVPEKISGVKMYYFAKTAGTYSGFGSLQLAHGIYVLYTDNGTSWTVTPLLELAQELGVSAGKVMSQKAINTELGKKFDKTSVAQNSGDSEELVMSQKAVSTKLSGLRTSIGRKADAEQVNNSLYDLEKKIGERFVVEGDVTNLPDEEDLTSVKQSERYVLKFADRSYAPWKFSGKGYKILRHNIKKFSFAEISITVKSAPTHDGDILFNINGIETRISLLSSSDSTVEFVAKKIAEVLSETMDEYNVIQEDNNVKLIRKIPGNITKSIYSALTTDVLCTISDVLNEDYRNVLTQDMINSCDTIYEIRYDFYVFEKELNIDSACFKFNGGHIIVCNTKIIGTLSNGYVEPDNFKSFNDTDDTNAIQTALDMASNVRLTRTYYISKGLIFRKGALVGISPNKSKIIVSKSFNDNILINDIETSYGGIIENISFDGDYKCNGIVIANPKTTSNNRLSFIMNNCNMMQFKTVILTIGTIDGVFSNCTISNGDDIGVSVKNVGNKINNFSVFFIKKSGIKVSTGTNLLSNCKVWYSGRILNKNFVDQYEKPTINNIAAYEIGGKLVTLDNCVSQQNYSSGLFLHATNCNVVNFNSYGDGLANFQDGISDIVDTAGIVIWGKNNIVEGNVLATINGEIWTSSVVNSIKYINSQYGNYINIGESVNYNLQMPFEYKSIGYNKDNIISADKVIINGEDFYDKVIMANSCFFSDININKKINGNKILIDSSVNKQTFDLMVISKGTYAFYLENTISGGKIGAVLKGIDKDTKTERVIRGLFVRDIVFNSSMCFTIDEDLDNFYYLYVTISITLDNPEQGNYISFKNFIYSNNGGSYTHLYKSGIGTNKPVISKNESLQPFLNITDSYLYFMTPFDEYKVRVISSALSEYGTSTLRPSSGIKTGFIFFDTKLNKPIWWNGYIWVDSNGNDADFLTEGASGARPELGSKNYGFEYYDTTLKKKILWNGTTWVNLDGSSLDIKKSGTTAERPASADIGFIYKDTTLNKLIIWDGRKWVNLDGSELS